MGRRILLAILTLFATAAVAQAQAGGRIAGRVSTAGWSIPSWIQVTVTGTALGAVSDTGGQYIIRNVPAGAAACSRAASASRPERSRSLSSPVRQPPSTSV